MGKGFNKANKKRRQEKELEAASEKLRNTLKESIVRSMLTGINAAYDLLNNRFGKEYEKAESVEDKLRIAGECFKYINEKNNTTNFESEATQSVEKE